MTELHPHLDLITCFTQGGDEKTATVVVAADASGSRTADAAGSPSAGGKPPIRHVQFNPHAKQTLYMLTLAHPLAVLL